MALIDLYRRYMYGQAPGMSVDTGDAPATGMATSGLFGTGGEPGRGGLLTTFDRPDTSGLLDVFSNPFVTIGLSGLQRGMAGQDISQAILPSVTEGFRTSSAVEKIKAANKKKKFIQDYSKKVPEQYKELFMAYPEKYIDLMIKKETATPTINKEVLSLYQQGRSATNFNEWYKSLTQPERDLYDSKIKPNLDFLGQISRLQSEEDQEDIKIKQKIPPLNEWLISAKEQNPNVSEKDLIDFYKDKYGK